MIVANNLVQQEYEDAWSAVRGLGYLQGTSESLSILERYVFPNPSFQLVAEAGMYIPNAYQYGIEVNYHMSGSYVRTTSSEQRTISESLSAGVSGAYGLFTAGASATATAQSSVNNAMASSNESVRVNSEKRGGDVSLGCLNDSTNTGTCADDVETAAQLVRAEVSRLGPPLGVDVYLSMDSFVFNYFEAKGESNIFGNRGFPIGFENALTVYYSYEKCSAVRRKACGGPRGCAETCPVFEPGSFVATYTGDGKISDGILYYCTGVCTASTRFKYIEGDQDQPEICTTTPFRRWCPGDCRYSQGDMDFLIFGCGEGRFVNPLITNFGPNPDHMLSQCEGDCDKDSMCEGDLICFNRDEGEPVPGCTGVPYGVFDYCIDP